MAGADVLEAHQLYLKVFYEKILFGLFVFCVLPSWINLFVACG